MTKKKSEDFKELQKKLKECQKSKDEYLAGWQRARADLLNYKKGESERLQEFLKFTTESWFWKFLSILDNFEVAEKKIPAKLKEDVHVKGILQIKKQLLDFLRTQGIEEIEALGLKFNPSFHEAVDEVETKDKESGTIIEEIQKGYKFDNKVLRPAKVKVAK